MCVEVFTMLSLVTVVEHQVSIDHNSLHELCISLWSMKQQGSFKEKWKQKRSVTISRLYNEKDDLENLTIS